MYKNGDKLICKRNYKTHLPNYFIEGNSYYVRGVLYEGDLSRHVLLLSDNPNGYGVANRSMHHLHVVTVQTHFWTEKELRKLKLKKLNNEN